eukprot:TRINITY_DN1138_c1_g2_i3.p1 TRINITY_DN1138_c1_g2~~TRINITY_DN1138_c1_g2_i3.p1  ORF type:complete len:309 (-),score=33.15 TRINITY_DN1138_c1_g2_i3:120-1046(-)
MLFPHIKPGACVPLTSALNVPAVPLRHPGFCCPHIRFMKAIHVFNLVLCLLALILPSLSASGTCSADTCNGAVDGDLDAMMVSYLCRATTLNDLADVYLAQGDYAEVAMLYARALPTCEKALGPEKGAAVLAPVLALLSSEQQNVRKVSMLLDAETTASRAEQLKAQGSYEEAAPLYARALALRQEVMGPKHSSVVASLNNLADLHKAQGNYAEAALLYARALTIYEEWLGPKNFIMATKLEDLANLHKTHGNYAEAALLYTRVLAIRKEVLGPEHALTFSTQHNLKLCLLMVMVIIVMVMVMVMLYW